MRHFRASNYRWILEVKPLSDAPGKRLLCFQETLQSENLFMINFAVYFRDGCFHCCFREHFYLHPFSSFPRKFRDWMHLGQRPELVGPCWYIPGYPCFVMMLSYSAVIYSILRMDYITSYVGGVDICGRFFCQVIVHSLVHDLYVRRTFVVEL